MKTKSYSPARVRSASYDEAANTIDIVWTTGAAVRRADPYTGDEYDEVLSLEPGAVRLDRLNGGAPFLDSHNSEGLANVIGSVIPGTAKIENGRGIATIQLSRAAADTDVVQKIRDGVIRNCSVGYWTFSSTRSNDDPPVVTATDWQPLEISAVAIPADAGAQIRSASRGGKAKPLSKAQREFQAGATQASRLLGAMPVPVSREQARGAARARSLKAGKGKLRTESVKPAAVEKDEVARGARAARRLLRKKA
jgi:Caudovirus prohead serine protease